MATLIIQAPPEFGATSGSSQELIPHDSPMAGFIWVNPGRMHGEPCFVGTRVPVQALFDHLRAGDGFEKFLDGYEGVTREQVVGVVDLAAHGLLAPRI